MPRAYCLSCNELVTVTAASTCPEGHPVSLETHGPEPWVGFAESARTDARRQAPTRLATTVNGRPASNGNGGGMNGNGHHAGSATSVDVADLPGSRPGRGGIPSTGGFEEQADELAALLSEALSEQTAGEAGSPAAPLDETAPLFPDEPAESAAVDAPPVERGSEPLGVERGSEPLGVERGSEPLGVERGSEPEGDDLFDDLPAPQGTEEPTPTGTESWDELASLAAELQLGDEVAARPTDVAPSVTTPDEPAYDVDSDEPFDLDGALAALQSSLGEPPSPPASAPPPPASPIDAPSAHEVADLPPPPPPATASPAAPPPPPPPAAPAPPPAVAAFDEAVGFVGPSDAPEPTAFLEESPPASPEAPPTEPGPVLDPANFTARGARVGATGPTKKRRKR